MPQPSAERLAAAIAERLAEKTDARFISVESRILEHTKQIIILSERLSTVRTLVFGLVTLVLTAVGIAVVNGVMRGGTLAP